MQRPARFAFSPPLIRWGTLVVVSFFAWMLIKLLYPAGILALPSEHNDHYIFVGAPTEALNVLRQCPPGMDEQLAQKMAIRPPAEGWPGTPQGIDVFNVISGEVRISHTERSTCGNMQDARTRDSRFRSGVGMVVAPPAGSHDPIWVFWEKPLKTQWVPTIRLGDPSLVQKADTERLLLRTACIAIALALILSSVMGFLTVGNREFLTYSILCVLLILWQSVISGLNGYPEPWLPAVHASSRWLLVFSSLSATAMLWVSWRLCGVFDRFQSGRRWLRGINIAVILSALLIPFLPLEILGPLATLGEIGFLIAILFAFSIGVMRLKRNRLATLDGLIALIPVIILFIGEFSMHKVFLQFRIEALQLGATWFLIISAYSMNRSLRALRQQRDEMRRLADTDALTGLLNRRAGQRELEQQIRVALQKKQPLTIAFVDLDHFKQINDRFGHEVGDHVLIMAAQTLRRGTRSSNDVARLGGEEFLVLFPGVQQAAAINRLKKLQDNLLFGSQALGYASLQVTASIGVAELDSDKVTSAAEFLHRADMAMYHAKQSGRNRIVNAVALSDEDLAAR